MDQLDRQAVRLHSLDHTARNRIFHPSCHFAQLDQPFVHLLPGLSVDEARARFDLHVHRGSIFLTGRNISCTYFQLVQILRDFEQRSLNIGTKLLLTPRRGLLNG